MVDTDPPTGHPRRIGWLIMGTESHGVESITTGLWHELSGRGTDLRVLTVRAGHIADRAREAGLPTTVLLPPVPARGLAARLRTNRLARVVVDSVRVARRLRTQIAADDLDLIQMSDIDLVLAARLAIARTGARICYLTPNRPPEHRLATRLIPWVLGAKRLRVLANSDDIQQRFAAIGVESTTLILGIDLEAFTVPAEARRRDPEGPARLVTIGRVCTPKAQDLWAGAAIELLRRGADLTLTVAGADHFEPEFTARLRAMVDESGFADRIHLLGQRSDVPQLLAAADIALCGTREIEAFGLSAVEALACERPVIVLGEGGIREIVDDGETGWFVPVPDLEHVTQTLQRCLTDRDRWDEMGEQGRRKVVAEYTMERVADRYLGLVAS